MTQTPAPLKRTPLRDVHVKAGAKMVPFGGWDMPVQYTGIIEEHRCVRSAVGLFDISHMGEFEVRGPGALGAVQRVTSNDASALAIGQVQYSLLCYPEGGIVDDLTLYRLADQHYMLTVNASNIDKDWEWVTEHGKGADWKNVSAETGLLAVQGPKAEGLVQRLADTDVTRVPYYHFVKGGVAGVPCVISRTGYTGEDGFELYARAVARHGYRMPKDGAEVGVVTSGSSSPSLERCIGMGYLRADLAPAGTELDVDIRGQAHRARVAKTPFVPSKAKKS